MNAGVDLVSILKSAEYNELLSCIEGKNPPASIAKHVSNIRSTRDALVSLAVKKDLTPDDIILQLEHTSKFGKLSSAPKYLNFVIENCSDEFIRNTVSVAHKAQVMIDSLVKLMKKQRKNKIKNTAPEPKTTRKRPYKTGQRASG